MRRSHLLLVLSLTATAASCNEGEGSKEPSPTLDPLAAAAPALSTESRCDAGFDAPPVGLRVVLRKEDGAGASLGVETAVDRVEGGRVFASRALVREGGGPTGPKSSVVRRDGFITLASGDADAPRTYVYGPEVSSAAIRAMRPGDTLTTHMVERSNIPGAGEGQAEGVFKIVFKGCTTLSLTDGEEDARVFDVTSVVRSYDARAAGGPTDETREVFNRYWISKRLGWVVRNDTPSGSLVAASIDGVG